MADVTSPSSSASTAADVAVDHGERRMVRSPTSLLRLIVGVTVTAVGVVITWRFANTMAALNRDWEQLTHLLPGWIRAIPPLVVGLTTAASRLVQVRRNRLLSLNESTETAYVDNDRVQAELQFANRMFADNNWPVIDVTRRSIEEAAAAVLRLYGEFKAQRTAQAQGTKPI